MSCYGSCGGEDVNKIKEQDNAEIENQSQEQKKEKEIERVESQE